MDGSSAAMRNKGKLKKNNLLGNFIEGNTFYTSFKIM